MTAPTVLSFLSHRPSFAFSCCHPPTYVEAYHLHSADLHTRTPRERLYHTTVVHQYEAPEEHIQPEQQLREPPQMALHRSLTPPPPTSSALSTLSYALAPLTSSTTPTLHSNPSSSHLSIFCSTFPSHTVVRQSHVEQPLPCNLVGGWKAEAGTVSRLAAAVPLPTLLVVAPLPDVLWRVVLGYSGDVYQQAEAHACHQDTELCRWVTKHSITPAPLMTEWMTAVMEDKGKMLVEHSRYQRFDASGAGWSHRQFLAFCPTSLSTACAPVLHPCTSTTFYLTKASVDAYRSYHQPNILEHYSYTRPPFQFPPVQGYIQRIGVVVDLPLDGSGSDERDSRHLEEAGGQLSPTLSVATTAESPDSGSPLLTPSLSPSQSPTPQSRPSPASYDPLYLHPVLSPRRSSLPTYTSSSSSSSSPSATAPPRGPASSLTPSFSSSSSSSSSSSKLPTDVFFSATWSVADSLYRHGHRSLLSEFLQVDVPRGACPWRTCTRVEFAYTFMPGEQQPLPCFIMHR